MVSPTGIERTRTFLEEGPKEVAIMLSTTTDGPSIFQMDTASLPKVRRGPALNTTTTFEKQYPCYIDLASEASTIILIAQDDV